MVRTHVAIAAKVVEEIDRMAGERGRSRFLENAAREKLKRIELEKALSATAAIAERSRYRHWKDREGTSNWVDAARRSGD